MHAAPRSTQRPRTAERAAAQIRRAWTELSAAAAGRTDSGAVIACSAGADSSALVLALAGRIAPLVVAHIVHDLRPRADAEADRDAAHDLARRVGAPFVAREVGVCDARAGNAEAAARRLRYAALALIARERGFGLVATAHHADDQAESALMALIRGAGPRGLSGLAPVRPIDDSPPPVAVVRPMLGVGRTDAEAICTAHDWTWRHDQTNADVRRLRAALRHGVLPGLERARPGASRRIARSGEHMRDLASLVDDLAGAWIARGRTGGAAGGQEPFLWPRSELAKEHAVIAGAALRAAAADLSGGRGVDRLSSRQIDRVVRAIRDDSGRARRFDWGEVVVGVEREVVRVTRKEEPDVTGR